MILGEVKKGDGGANRTRTGVAGFADLCLTTRQSRHIFWCAYISTEWGLVYIVFAFS